MKQLHSYLTFNGNCREAMTFYQSCFGGELFLQSMRESPLSAGLPDSIKDSIVHSTLTSGKLILMGSDMISDEGLFKGNAVSIMADCSNEKEIFEIYDRLSVQGVQSFPVKKNYWGALFGSLTDKYGNHWLLHYQKSK